jgi:hypothetical protein
MLSRYLLSLLARQERLSGSGCRGFVVGHKESIKDRATLDLPNLQKDFRRVTKKKKKILAELPQYQGICSTHTGPTSRHP